MPQGASGRRFCRKVLRPDLVGTCQTREQGDRLAGNHGWQQNVRQVEQSFRSRWLDPRPVPIDAAQLAQYLPQSPGRRSRIAHETADRLGLQLADSLPRDTDDLGGRLQGVRCLIMETQAVTEDVPVSRLGQLAHGNGHQLPQHQHDVRVPCVDQGPVAR